MIQHYKHSYVMFYDVMLVSSLSVEAVNNRKCRLFRNRAREQSHHCSIYHRHLMLRRGGSGGVGGRRG